MACHEKKQTNIKLGVAVHLFFLFISVDMKRRLDSFQILFKPVYFVFEHFMKSATIRRLIQRIPVVFIVNQTDQRLDKQRHIRDPNKRAVRSERHHIRIVI